MISYYLGQGAIWLITFYKRAVSPYIPPACRHEPTCSTYALESINKHGLWRGSTLATRRILRCNPLGTKGYDPVP